MSRIVVILMVAAAGCVVNPSKYTLGPDSVSDSGGQSDVDASTDAAVDANDANGAVDAADMTPVDQGPDIPSNGGTCTTGACTCGAQACVCADDCNVQCLDSCITRCTAGKCTVDADADAAVTCGPESDCDLQCAPGVGCAMLCESGSACDLSCRQGECLLTCEADSDCNMSSCQDEVDCGQGVFVCNRPCP